MTIENVTAKKKTNVQSFVDAIASAQKRGDTSVCPRCGKKAPQCASPMIGARSRRADIFVCSECGLDEALEDYHGCDKIQLSEWALFSEDYDG